MAPTGPSSYREGGDGQSVEAGQEDGAGWGSRTRGPQVSGVWGPRTAGTFQGPLVLTKEWEGQLVVRGVCLPEGFGWGQAVRG